MSRQSWTSRARQPVLAARAGARRGAERVAAVASRFVHLDDAAVAMLERLTVAGADLGPAEVVAVSGLREPLACAVLDAALDAGSGRRRSRSTGWPAGAPDEAVAWLLAAGRRAGPPRSTPGARPAGRRP
jgi:hypothetical protein